MANKTFTVKRRDGTTRTLDREATGDKLFNKMWQNQSDFTMKSIHNSGLTKEEIKQSWLASKGYKGLIENLKDDVVYKLLTTGSKLDTGYKNVAIQKALGSFKTIIDSIVRTKEQGNKGNVPRKTIAKASLFKKKNGEEIASLSLTKNK